jgi:hypothetical protein
VDYFAETASRMGAGTKLFNRFVVKEILVLMRIDLAAECLAPGTQHTGRLLDKYRDSSATFW